MPKIKVYPPLNEAQLKLCPYGDVKCRLCRLRPDQLEELHAKKFKSNFGYNEIRLYCREQYNMGIDYTDINQHFNKHVLGKHQLQRILEKNKDIQYPEIMKALEPMSSDVKITTSVDLEHAYATLVKMAQSFVKRTRKLQEKISLTFEIREKNKELDEEFDRLSILDLFEKQAKLNKEARDFIKDVGALRAPKIMVAQFLEAFIDDVIRELSILIANLCGELQYDVNAELSDAGHPNMLTNETFTNIFRKTALDYRDRMINLKRQKMADSMAALADLEKII